MSKKIFKTAVIGLGRIGWQTHLPVLHANPDKYHISAVVDPLAERGSEGVETFGADRSYLSIEDMLADQTPDLAVVCSPTLFHAPQSIQLLEHGVNVFCDKPVASDLAETRAMFAAAEKANRKLMVFQPRRTFPNSFAIREIMKTGKLGRIYQLKIFIGAYGRRSDWQAFRKNGGGMLRNYGAHYVDQMMYLIGEPLEPLMCQTATIASLGDADDVVKIVLRARKSGILADIDINQASGFNPYVWALYGSCGAAYLAKYDNRWQLHYFNPEELGPHDISAELAAPNREYPHETIPIPFKDESYQPAGMPRFDQYFYDNLYDYLLGKADPLVPPSDTLALMETLEQCRIMAEGK